MSDKEAVLAAHPDAACWMNPDSGQYLILRPDGSDAWLWIPLSSAWETQTMAWYEAAEAIRQKETAQS